MAARLHPSSAVDEHLAGLCARQTSMAGEAGPDLDRRVELEIFGSSREPRRFYSIDDAAAQSVIERVQNLVPGARVRCIVDDHDFRCEWTLGATVLASAVADRAALATCLASLEACRAGSALASGQLRRRSAPAWLPAPAGRPGTGLSAS
jgi:hypothetical protein